MMRNLKRWWLRRKLDEAESNQLLIDLQLVLAEQEHRELTNQLARKRTELRTKLIRL